MTGSKVTLKFIVVYTRRTSSIRKEADLVTGKRYVS
jgi:hypothetical protein